MGYRSIKRFLTPHPHPPKKRRKSTDVQPRPTEGFEPISSEFYSLRIPVHTDTTELFIIIVKSTVTADVEPFKRYTSTTTITH
jgi:hypothetical protein